MHFWRGFFVRRPEWEFKRGPLSIKSFFAVFTRIFLQKQFNFYVN
jgi:hypothetical protein